MASASRSHAVALAALPALAALVVLAACGGAPNRSRSQECKVDVFPNPPGPDYVEVGELSFEAYAAASPDRQYRNPYALAADLHGQICAVGGDTLVTERNALGVIVRGTVYRHAELRDLQPPPPARPSRTEVCEPSCGPGTTCEGGTCIPQCAAPCAEGETCGSDGACHANS